MIWNLPVLREGKNLLVFLEIIEIRGVFLDIEHRKIVEEYQTFVKPVLFPKLSTFCKELTTITQQEVDQGCSLLDAVLQLQKLTMEHEALFCSWGFYDRNQFQESAQRFGVPYPFGEKHLNLKLAHQQFYGYQRKMGMKAALNFHRIPLSGTHHRGIDDARNITKIVIQMLQDGWNPIV